MILQGFAYINGELKNHIVVVSEIDGDVFVAQAFTFLAAGFETSGSALSYALYELAKHPEIQQRLREEILQVMSKHDGKVTYNGIQEMVYLDMVVSGETAETFYIRLWGYVTGDELCPTLCVREVNIRLLMPLCRPVHPCVCVCARMEQLTCRLTDFIKYI